MEPGSKLRSVWLKFILLAMMLFWLFFPLNQVPWLVIHKMATFHMFLYECSLTHTLFSSSVFFLLSLKSHILSFNSLVFFSHFSQILHFCSFFSPLCTVPILCVLSHSTNRPLWLTTCWLSFINALTNGGIRSGVGICSIIEIAEKDDPVPREALGKNQSPIY